MEEKSGNANQLQLNAKETADFLEALKQGADIKQYHLNRSSSDGTVEFLTLAPRLTNSGSIEYDLRLQSSQGSELKVACYRFNASFDEAIDAVKSVI